MPSDTTLTATITVDARGLWPAATAALAQLLRDEAAREDANGPVIPSNTRATLRRMADVFEQSEAPDGL